MQKLIKKNIQLEKIKKNFEIAHALKIHSHGFFMIGFPGESLEEMKMTVRFMVSSNLHTIALFVVMPFEGTELGKLVREMGKAPVSDFSMSYHSENFINLTDVPAKQINRIRLQALMKFYLNPAVRTGEGFPEQAGIRQARNGLFPAPALADLKKSRSGRRSSSGFAVVHAHPFHLQGYQLEPADGNSFPLGSFARAGSPHRL
jgi:hypothetical protein